MNKNNKQSTSREEAKQMGRFGLIGLINTSIDLGLYNIGIIVLSLGVIPANVLSATVAMSFSFVANKTYVFRSKDRTRLQQALIFLAVTGFSVYVIQNVVLYLFTNMWPYSFEFWYELLEPVLGKLFSLEFAINNGAKAIALGCGMVWNYFMYKKVVFKK